MSRIDEALRRASGAAIDDPKIADRVEPTEEPVLQHYAAESGVFHLHPVATDPLPRRIGTAAPPTRRGGWLTDPSEFTGKLVVSNGASPMAIEQYRRLAGTIHEIQAERGLKTLMVTSSIPNEGKTLTVSNLALTLSESYRRRVLLIDADLRRPMIHELFRVGNDQGLGEVLRSTDGEIPLRQVSDNLTVLTAGDVDQPLEGLTSEAMRALLERCAATFDWVLLDAPPVGMMPDARLLASLTRAVLFVIAARSTPHQIVTRALAEFDPDSLVGTVLNRVQERDIPATDYYKDYYYRTDRRAE